MSMTIWTEDWSSIKRKLDDLARDGVEDWRRYFKDHRDLLKTIYDLADITEISRAAKVVSDAADPEANIIFGATVDPELEGKVWVTVVAAGFTPGEADQLRRGMGRARRHMVSQCREGRDHAQELHCREVPRRQQPWVQLPWGCGQ